MDTEDLKKIRCFGVNIRFLLKIHVSKRNLRKPSLDWNGLKWAWTIHITQQNACYFTRPLLCKYELLFNVAVKTVAISKITRNMPIVKIYSVAIFKSLSVDNLLPMN